MTIARLLVILLAAGAIATFCGIRHVQGASVPRAVTFFTPSECYEVSCTTASGATAYAVEGAAACGAAFPLWTRLWFVGTDVVVTCIDRGDPDYFYSTEVGIFVRTPADGFWLMDLLWGLPVVVVGKGE